MSLNPHPDFYHRQKTIAVIAMVFGLLTVVSGATALFGGDKVQALAGNIVSFVLWFNFLFGFLYMTAGAGIYWNRYWALPLSIMIALSTLVVFCVLGWHIMSGQAYENRTIAAMTLRSAFWLTISVTLFRTHKKVAL